MPRRLAITIEQKQALRAHRRAFPTSSNLEVKRWFEVKYQQIISPSSVSEILSTKYIHLDNQINRPQSQKRLRQPQWPELEDALLQWIQHAETSIPISSTMIRQKAEFFWMNMPQYQGLPMPSLSNGWLHRFQSRRGTAHRVQRGGLSSSTSAPAERQSIRQGIGPEPNDLQILAQSQAPDDEEEEEDAEIIPRVSSTDALEAVKLLRLYLEQQEKCDLQVIHALNKLSLEIEKEFDQNRQPGDIRSYFSI